MSAYFVLFLSFIYVTFASDVTASHLKSCYLLFGEVSDLGFTYSHDIGRRMAATTLRSMGYNVISLYWTNAHLTNQSIIYDYFIQNETCDLIVAASSSFTEMLMPYVRRYRNVTFAAFDPYNIESTEPNLIVYGMRQYEVWYMAGVVAAMETNQGPDACINHIVAYEKHPEVVSQTNAFALGAQRVAPHITINVVVMNDWFNPEGEINVAKNLKRLTPCKVFSHISDPFTLNAYVASLSNVNIGYWSIGIHSNVINFIGDTVLTSAYNVYDSLYMNISLSVINRKDRSRGVGGTLWWGVGMGATIAGDPSPQASNQTVSVFQSVYEQMKQGAFQPLCNVNLSSNRGGCLTDSQIRAMNYYVKGVFVTQYQTGVQACTPGQRYTYGLRGHPGEEALSVICYDCEPNTFSVYPLLDACMPCEGGGFSSGKATHCDTGMPAGIVAAIVIACVIGLLTPLFIKLYLNHKKVEDLLNNDKVATELAESVAMMEFDQVSYLDNIQSPTRLQMAFIMIVATLKKYKSYMPQSLFTGEDSLEERESDMGTPLDVPLHQQQALVVAMDVKSESTISAPSTPRKLSSAASLRRLRTGAGNTIEKSIGHPFINKQMRVAVLSLSVHGTEEVDALSADFEKRYGAVLKQINQAVASHKGVITMFFAEHLIISYNAATFCSAKGRAVCQTIRDIRDVLKAVNSSFSSTNGAPLGREMWASYGAASSTAVCGDVGEQLRSFGIFGTCVAEAQELDRRHHRWDLHQSEPLALFNATLYDETMADCVLKVSEVYSPDYYPEKTMICGFRAVVEVLALKDKTSEDEWMYTLQDRGVLHEYNEVIIRMVQGRWNDDWLKFVQKYESHSDGALQELATRMKLCVDVMKCDQAVSI